MRRGSAPFTHLGRYRVVRELGRGAMGVVYLADDESLQRQVAVKTLLLPSDPAERAHLEARFRQEAKAAGGLNHPGIITIHDLGREGDWLYIAMELLQGAELRDRMAQGPLPLEEALDIAAQVASALAAAHARGVVHRDIKPGNIMLVGNGQAKIMDFGIARMPSSELRTQSGTMMGSPKFMSPEQVGGHGADHRSDIFSLGSMLYEMVCGMPAFGGDNLGELLNAILKGKPVPPSQFRPGIPPELDAVIARAMQKNAAARYQDAEEMARDLAEIRATLTPTRGFAPPATDPYATTVRGDAIPRLELEGLPPSVLFDSSVGLKRLLAATTGNEASVAGRPRRSWRASAWAAVYLGATLAALYVAFG
jgi:serine/threonine-protein kinase